MALALNHRLHPTACLLAVARKGCAVPSRSLQTSAMRRMDFRKPSWTTTIVESPSSGRPVLQRQQVPRSATPAEEPRPDDLLNGVYKPIAQESFQLSKMIVPILIGFGLIMYFIPRNLTIGDVLGYQRPDGSLPGSELPAALPLDSKSSINPSAKPPSPPAVHAAPAANAQSAPSRASSTLSGALRSFAEAEDDEKPRR